MHISLAIVSLSPPSSPLSYHGRRTFYPNVQSCFLHVVIEGSYRLVSRPVVFLGHLQYPAATSHSFIHSSSCSLCIQSSTIILPPSSFCKYHYTRQQFTFFIFTFIASRPLWTNLAVYMPASFFGPSPYQRPLRKGSFTSSAHYYYLYTSFTCPSRPHIPAVSLEPEGLSSPCIPQPPLVTIINDKPNCIYSFE